MKASEPFDLGPLSLGAGHRLMVWATAITKLLLSFLSLAGEAAVPGRTCPPWLFGAVLLGLQS